MSLSAMMFIVGEVQRPITIVTGAGRGIGAATALHLARIGHDVVVNYRQDHGAATRVVDMAWESGARAIAVAADVTQEDDVERLFALTRDALGPVSGLVNNAGATLHIGNLADTPVATIRAVIDVNLLGAILCSRHAAQLMSTGRGGTGGAIVNVSSAAAGAPDRAENAAARIPMGRAADAHEIAVAIAWLLGPEATYVTGAILRVSGGL